MNPAMTDNDSVHPHDRCDCDAVPDPIDGDKTIPDPVPDEPASSVEHDNPEAVARDADQWMAILYDDLRKLARQRMLHQRPGHTLQPTAVLHEVYARMKRDDKARWNSREHFYYTAAKVMRSVIVDYARRRSAKRRGGHLDRVTITNSIRDEGQGMTVEELLQLDEALDRLTATQPEYARLVLLRYFGGLTIAEVAEATGISPRTVERKLRFARAWLKTRLTTDSDLRPPTRISRG
jgi:RNA polymerase sigma factor (TIGR02999 family)